MVAINEILLPECTGEECCGDGDTCTDSRIHQGNAENRAPVTRNHRGAPILGRWLTRDPIGYEGGINLYAYVDGEAANAIDSAGLAKLSFTAIGPLMGVDSMFAPRILHVVINPQYDLLDLWHQIKNKVGRYDRSGKCGNCIRVLDIFAHGQPTWQALRDHSRYQLIGKGHGKVGQRACSLPNRILKNKVTIGSWGGSQITAATAQFFRDVESLACGDGVIVRFIGCNTATGRRGRKMLGEVHAITHSPVYGYEGDVYPPFDFLWHQISVPAPPPLAPVPISVYTFYN